MADEVIYKRPNEIYYYEYDFSPKLASNDTTITAGSTVTAIDEEGNSATSTVVSGAAVSGTTLSAKLIAGTNGKDYTITYHGIGSTSSYEREWVVEMRVRSKLGGTN